MKKTLIFLFFIPYFLIAQKQFAPLDATWKNELHSFECTNNFIRYSVEKEIEIDGKDCSVIYAYTSYDFGPFNKSDDSLIVWENDNKVYFHQFDEFHLVYDFNLEIGDTLDYFLPTGRIRFSPLEEDPNDTAVIAATLYVEDITEVDVNGMILKEFETKQIYAQGQLFHAMEDIVENVGSTSGRVLGHIGIHVASGCGPSFFCYENEDYSYPPDVECEYPTGTENIYTDSEIRFFPNPTYSYLNIENNTDEVINQIQIFDITGRHVDTFNGSQSILQLNELDNGIYFVNLTFDSGNTHIRKVLKY